MPLGTFKHVRLAIQLRKVACELLGAALAGFSLSACQSSEVTIISRLGAIQQIPVSFGDYQGIAWLSDDHLVVGYDPDPQARNPGSYLWIMRTDGSDLEMLNLPQDERYQCLVSDFFAPVRMPDGRLAFLRDCSTKQGLYITRLAWDPQTGVVERLDSYELPTQSALFTVAPDLSRGLLSSNTHIEDKLYWLDVQVYSLLDVGLARAAMPAWSPDGKSIVFFGNRRMPGPPGPHWAVQPLDLWIMPVDCEGHPGGCGASLQLIARDIYNPTNISWSPDGRWLAFDGQIRGHGEGIWLMQVDTRQIYQVASGRYQVPEWSPDGQRIVVSGPPERLGREEYPQIHPTLYIIDVDEVISEISDSVR